jgi:hypothetical protein
MMFCVVKNAAIADSSKYVAWEADWRKQSSVDSFLNPAKVLQWIVNLPRR